MVMKNFKSYTQLLNGFGLPLLITLLTAALPLSVIAQTDSFSVEQRTQFYLKLMPQQQQVENTLNLSDFDVIQKSCFQTDYVNWARPMKSSEEINQRFTFLTDKLNRSFFFQFVPRTDSKLHVIGSIVDFREMICVSLVLNDGKVGDEATAGVPSGFIKSVLRLPKINSQVLDLMLGLWENSDRDPEAVLTIIKHPLFNQFNLRDLIGSLFKKPMPMASRTSILQAILRSDYYSKYSDELLPLLLNESTNFINPEERYIIVTNLANEKKFDRTALLNFAATQVDPSKDYTDLYQQLSHMQTVGDQFQILTSLLYAGANIQNVESIFLEIWKQSTSRDLKDSMMAFAQHDFSKSKWLSHDTVHRVTLERLAEPVSANTINSTMLFYRSVDTSTPEIKLNVMRRLALQLTSFDATNAKNFIDTARDFSTANPSFEAAVTQTVADLANRFRDNDSVLLSYVGYLEHMKNKKSEMLLVQKLLPESRIEERDLLTIVRDTYDANFEASYFFLELVLAQPQITAKGLTSLTGIVRPTKFVGFTPDLNTASRKILTLILSHSKATDEVRKEVNRYLNPSLTFIDDPVSNKH